MSMKPSTLLITPMHNSTSPSLVLLDSALPSSTSLTTSTTSGSTIPGPGALSGKAILALGKITLRGAEFIIIRRRLHVIASKFPIADATYEIKEIEEMYDDLLELSRPGLYSSNIRDRALRILLAQISQRQTRHIVNCLRKLPDIEVQIFLSELMTLFDPIRLSLHGRRDETNIKVYRTALPPLESHSLVPVIQLVGRLVEAFDLSKSPRSFRGIILDFLLHLYATNFRDSLAITDSDVIHRTSILYSACVHLLQSLCDIKSGIDFIFNHPLRALWPIRPRLPITIPLGLDRMLRRLDSWDRIPQEIVLVRLHTTSHMMRDFTKSLDESTMHDICTDSMELAGSKTMHMEIRVQALKLLYLFSLREDVAAQSIIGDHLLTQTRERSVQIISEIIQILARVQSEKTPEFNLFYSNWPWSFGDAPIAFEFLCLFLNLAESSETLLSIILAADVLGLMRSFLEIELRGDPERQIAFHSGDMLTVYDPQYHSLLQLIQEHGLEWLLRPLARESAEFPTWHRRIQLCRAFDIFMGRQGRTFEIPIRMPVLFRER